MAEADAFPLRLRNAEEYARLIDDDVHVFGKGHRCRTDKRGRPTPKGRSLFEIRVDATGGFVPLWEQNRILRYRFDARSLNRFEDPEALAARIRQLFGEGLAAWGDSAPIRFAERAETCDFEFVVRNADDCDDTGCVLASTFFPDQGQHEFVIYPEMFNQTREEQVETMVHEIGHIFGLRHFFADVAEDAWPSELFGEDSRFSIMNYGANSYLTNADRADLKALYGAVWSGRLDNVNGTPIRQVRPYSSLRP
ncbi:MAG TPA: matrixin family metalloprotease [Allosphingosinicella sp.]|jgi:hypothetical protein